MEQQNTVPNTAKKRKLPSFMAAPVRTQQSSHNDAQERDLHVQSPKKKENGKSTAAKKQRQGQLPVQRRKTVAKSARAQDQLSHQQQKVLTTSDAALVKQCKDILSRSAASTGVAQAGHQPSDKGWHKHVLLPVQPQPVCLDIMDAETQQVEVSPRATLKYEAAHQPQLAHCPADQTHSQKDMGFTIPAKASAPADSADMHDSQAQPEARGELLTSSMALGSAADSQLTGAAAGSADVNHMKQPPVSTSTTVVQPDPLVSAAPAPSQGGNGSMNALLTAMLTGELA